MVLLSFFFYWSPTPLVYLRFHLYSGDDYNYNKIIIIIITQQVKTCWTICLILSIIWLSDFSLRATQQQESGGDHIAPSYTPKENTHQTTKRDLQYTLMSSHITKAYSSCSVARLLSVSVWRMSHIHSFCEHRPQVHEHTINSPTLIRLMSHWTSLQVLIDKPRTKVSCLPQLRKHQGIVTSSHVAFRRKVLSRLFFKSPNWLRSIEEQIIAKTLRETNILAG